MLTYIIIIIIIILVQIDLPDVGNGAVTGIRCVLDVAVLLVLLCCGIAIGDAGPLCLPLSLEISGDWKYKFLHQSWMM